MNVLFAFQIKLMFPLFLRLLLVNKSDSLPWSLFLLIILLVRPCTFRLKFIQVSILQSSLLHGGVVQGTVRSLTALLPGINVRVLPVYIVDDHL
ncbi:hypothetical protein DWB78_00575 [Halopelagius longus]|uniref:Uncharacterized protein n=1 Tax=Halopelagius longus TaxID=1236180 RepID=A0A1H1ADC6_9EURY|nr:hypothetical protein DWB78_00575 [Halopelagius longus]SDQ37644.1 hypothetical protein SAMN05216278_1282 [Halopelagius longus]